MKKILFPIMLASLALTVASGCSHLFLPKTEEIIISPWETYEDAENAFNAIQLHRTTEDDLQKMGYNPYETPNIKILTYLEMLERFIPNQSVTKNDINEELALCLDAKDTCKAYFISAKNIKKVRYGNIFLDILRFKRKIRKYGWVFTGFIAMKDQKVIYKIHSGDPKIEEYQVDTNPLGFLQDPAGLISNATTGVVGF